MTPSESVTPPRVVVVDSDGVVVLDDPVPALRQIAATVAEVSGVADADDIVAAYLAQAADEATVSEWTRGAASEIDVARSRWRPVLLGLGIGDTRTVEDVVSQWRERRGLTIARRAAWPARRDELKSLGAELVAVAAGLQSEVEWRLRFAGEADSFTAVVSSETLDAAYATPLFWQRLALHLDRSLDDLVIETRDTEGDTKGWSRRT